MDPVAILDLANKAACATLGKPGETATAFTTMAKAYAALAFVPGGVRVNNQDIEAER